MAQEAVLDDVRSYRHGRVPREVRSRQILTVAEELFIERGYRHASMDELARRVGVSKPVVYEIAGSKEFIYRACVSRWADELADCVRSAVHGATGDRLHAGALAWFTFVASHRQRWFMLISSDDRPSSDEIEQVRRRQADLVVELVAETIPGLLDRRPVEAIAWAMNGAFESLALWWNENPDIPAETMASFVTDLVTPGISALTRLGHLSISRT